MRVEGLQIPAAYTPLTGEEAIEPEHIRYLEGRRQHGAFRFDETSLEYQEFYERCKMQEKEIRTVMDACMANWRLPFRCKGGSNIRCLRNQGKRKITFLLRPLLFDPPDEVPKDNRMPQHSGNTNIAMHIDEQGTYQLTRWWLHTKSYLSAQNALLNTFASDVCSRALRTREELSNLLHVGNTQGAGELLAESVARSFYHVATKANHLPDWYMVERGRI